MRQADLAGPRRRPSAHKREVGSGVMRRAKRPRAEHRMARVGEAGHAVDGTRRKRLSVFERRKNGFEGAREHRLASARWADEEQVVTAGRGDLEGALRG